MAGTTEERVKSIITAELGVDDSKVTPSANFETDLGADSLDLVELKMSVEEEFGIEIPDAEAAKLKTVREALTYIDKKVKL
jgi:acyl carrier protein